MKRSLAIAALVAILGLHQSPPATADATGGTKVDLTFSVTWDPATVAARCQDLAKASADYFFLGGLSFKVVRNATPSEPDAWDGVVFLLTDLGSTPVEAGSYTARVQMPVGFGRVVVYTGALCQFACRSNANMWYPNQTCHSVDIGIPLANSPTSLVEPVVDATITTQLVATTLVSDTVTSTIITATDAVSTTSPLLSAASSTTATETAEFVSASSSSTPAATSASSLSAALGTTSRLVTTTASPSPSLLGGANATGANTNDTRSASAARRSATYGLLQLGMAIVGMVVIAAI